MRIKQTSHQEQELEFLQTSRNIAHVLAKEIESIYCCIENTKEEKLFCEQYTKNFQSQLEYHQIIFQYERMMRKLIKSKLNFECISHKPININ